MQTILNNTARIGNFTSSEIYRLMAPGKRDMDKVELAMRPKSGKGSKATTVEDIKILSDTALEYILEKNMEREFGRSLSCEAQARALSWGKVCEKYLSENKDYFPIGSGYSMNMDKTTTHPEIGYWAGSEDALTEDAVVDFKCPLTLKSFYLAVEPLYRETPLTGIEAMNVIREQHPDGEKFYWQLVSNACIHNNKYAELIVFCPYKSELGAIRETASNYDAENLYPYQWITYAHDAELPYLIDGGKFKSLNIIRFYVPTADKKALTEKVKQAGAKLINT